MNEKMERNKQNEEPMNISLQKSDVLSLNK